MPRGFAQTALLLTIFVIIIWGVVLLLLKNQFSGANQLQTPSYQPALFNDPYQGWKTYKNDTYNFNLRFPKNWYILQFSDLAANFQQTNPEIREATPAAIKVRFSAQSDPLALKEFEKINKAKVGEQIREPLDVVSIITKARDFEIGANLAVQYTTDRTFTALEGPPKEYRHTYAIKKDETILKFIASASTMDELNLYKEDFQKMIESINF